MNDLSRRRFLGIVVGGIATVAAVRTFPFRVFSFPSDIKIGGLTFYDLEGAATPLYPIDWSMTNLRLATYGAWPEVATHWKEIMNVRN